MPFNYNVVNLQKFKARILIIFVMVLLQNKPNPDLNKFIIYTKLNPSSRITALFIILNYR